MRLRGLVVRITEIGRISSTEYQKENLREDYLGIHWNNIKM
jgi:hypothetical protein